MSQSRREIVFNARDNGVGDFMSKLRQSANELGRDLIRESMQNSSSAQEAVKYYEQQVRLLEKKTRLEQKSTRASLDSRYNNLLGKDGANQSKLSSDYKDQISDLQRSTREDTIQLDLLRELIDTVKLTSNEEVRSDNKNSTREQSSAERSRLASDVGPEATDLADQLSEEGGGGSGGGSGGKRSRLSGLNVGSLMKKVATSGDSVGAVNSVLEQANDMEIMGTGLGILTGVIGTSVAALNIRAQREKSAEMMSALSGLSIDSILDQGIGGTEFGGYGAGTLGVSREDFLSNNIPSTIRALGTSRNAGRSAVQSLEVQKGFGVDQSTVGTLDRLSRVMEGVAGSQALASKVYSSMYGTGALGQNNNDMARMQDIMQGFASFQEGQFMRSGTVDGTTTLGLMRSLQNLGGNFQRDDYAFDTINRLNSGLSQGGSPESNAIKFDVLRRQNPNKSFFELQMEMEKGVNSKGYLSGMFDYVKNTGGDVNSQSMLFDQLTGGSMRKKDIFDLISGKTSLDQINTEGDARDPSIQQRAASASSGAQAELLNFTESFKDVMEPVGEQIEELIKLVGEMNRKIDL